MSTMDSIPDWFVRHERDDSERQGEIMGALAGIDTRLAKVETRLEASAQQLGRVEDRQWEENSKVGHPPPQSSRPPRDLTTRALLGLIGAVVVLGHLATELAKALIGRIH